MKRLIYIIGLLLAFCYVSCSKEEIKPVRHDTAKNSIQNTMEHETKKGIIQNIR